MFGNSASRAGGAATGTDLETIQTEGLGFLPLAGEAKVRLVPSWASPPAETASLLSIASRKGLVAAAGPEQIVVATTESVRKAFTSSDVFEPQLSIPAPTRVSHLAYTADESYLVLSAESGGGLAVYDVQTLLQGSTNALFELPTNGESLRALAPNPTAEKAHLCALVTTSGNLYMANLSERKLSNPLRSRVSSLSWSAKGKQLCAGMVDGTISQMTPEGEGKGEIPKPPNSEDCYVSSLIWLENNLFLAIYTATNEPSPSSIYHIINRQPPSTFTFQKITDPVEPFGAEKPPHHVLLRLRDFLDLQDLLIVSSTASTEVGILTRSKTPLAHDKPAGLITNVFTTTEFLEDTRRPTLPMTESMVDSVAIGVALDLSSKEKVYKPIPSDEELDQSLGPLPGFWVLTNEGLLCSWWLVYNDAVKKGHNYPGLSVNDNNTASASTPTQTTPLKPASFATADSSPFASTTPTTAPTFGSSSRLGQQSSSWAASTNSPAATGGAIFGSSSFGNPPSDSGLAFGKPSALGFGQSSQLGIRTSPWAARSGSRPAFGQSAFANFSNGASNQSPFGSPAPDTNTPDTTAAPVTPAASGGVFSEFSSRGGFASLSATTGNSGGFGSGGKFGTSSFGTTSDSSNTTDSAFTATQQNPSNVFGSAPFKLESSFRADAFQEETNEENSSGAAGSSLFGPAFGSALGDVADQRDQPTPSAKEDDMDTTEETPQAKSQSLFAPQQTQESTTPTTTPAGPRFGFSTPTPGTSAPGQDSKPKPASSNLFGARKDAAKPETSSLFGSAKAFDSTASHSEVKSAEEDAPLPSDTESEVDKLSSSSATVDHSRLSAATSTPLKADSAISASDAAAMSTPLKTDSAMSSSDATTPKPSQTPTDTPLPLASTKDLEPAEAPLSPNFENVLIPADKSKAEQGTPTPPSSPSSKHIKVEPGIEEDDAPLPPDFVLPEAPFKEPSNVPSIPETTDGESDLREEEASEGSGVDVANDFSPSTSDRNATPGISPQSSFSALVGNNALGTASPEERARPLFGEISRTAPVFPKPTQASPRSPSPMRGAVPPRVIRPDATRSVSAPGMASQILGSRQGQAHHGSSIISSREIPQDSEDPFMRQHRQIRERQEAEETQPLVDEEDDEVQKILNSEVEGTLQLHEFIAHSDVAPPAKESVPAQVEAVYRDVNSMIDTLGLNARSIKAFTKGHNENAAEGGRGKQDLEIPDDWVLCEINDLGDVLDSELHGDLEDGRVQDMQGKLEACQDLLRDMQRLRAKQEDLKRVVMARADPEQAELARLSPLSAEQAAQQSELRREYGAFTSLLTEAEEALILLKTRIAAASSSSGKGSAPVPTVEAVMRTISKMTSMVEKRSGDVDVLETQLRKMRLGSSSREGSPMRTPQGRKSFVLLSPDPNPSRTFRQSPCKSPGVNVASPIGATKATPSRKKMSGLSNEEKGDVVEKRARRQIVLSKLKESVGKRGVTVWTMEEIE